MLQTPGFKGRAKVARCRNSTSHDRTDAVRLRLAERRPVRGLGLIGLGAVLCFHFPELLTTPEARALYPLPYVRALLHLVLVAAFVLGVVSLSLRRNKALGTVGVCATLIAAVLGGSRVAGRRRARAGAVSGTRLVPAQSDRLFARLRSDRAALRAVAGTGRVSARVAH